MVILVLRCVFMSMLMIVFVVMSARLIAMTAFGAMLRIMSVRCAMPAVGTVDMLHTMRVAVRMCVHDLRIRKKLFPACAFGKAQDAVRIRADLLNVVRDHEDRDLFLNI